MTAHRAVRDTSAGPPAMDVALKKVDAAKVALGERGPVWWDDGAPDFNRYLAKNTLYLEWSEKLTMESWPLYHRHNPWGGEINAINSSFVEVF
ncbi:hypothetical protein [Agrobacterium rubi]|uniref:hypothetical protein n=1 Tax=Agrobacterium rubi TaxID=28099 RepID=UPI00201B65CA|nr:hypothetical protein [Agrobacterium rubi]